MGIGDWGLGIGDWGLVIINFIPYNKEKNLHKLILHIIIYNISYIN